MEICIATDDAYVKYCATVILSGIKNKKEEDELNFHIIYGNLCDENIKKLQELPNVVLHQIDDEIFAPYQRKAKHTWPTSTLYRLKLSSLLNLDKIIYLDCDVIIRASLKELWETNIENYYAAAVPDVNEKPHIKRLGLKEEGFYFNAGVMLINLKKIKQDNMEEKMFNYLVQNYQELIFNDQDVLNYTLEGKVKKLDTKFNFIPYTAYQTKEKRKKDYGAIIVHHAGIKPWEKTYRNSLRDEFWQYFKLFKHPDYNKMYKQYCSNQNKFAQIIMYLKQRPFALFTSRRTEFFNIIFD